MIQVKFTLCKVKSEARTLLKTRYLVQEDKSWCQHNHDHTIYTTWGEKLKS